MRSYTSLAIVLPIAFFLSLLSISRAQTPVALPYTMTTMSGGFVTSAYTANSTLCPGSSTVKATTTFGDGCPAIAAYTNVSSTSRGGVVVDAYGNVFVADDTNKIAHMIDANTGIMSVLAGGGTTCSGKIDTLGDGCIAATQTSFSAASALRGIGIDPYGNILLAGYNDNAIHIVCRAASPLCTTSTPSVSLSNPIQVQVGYMGLVAGCMASATGFGTAGVGLDNTAGFSSLSNSLTPFKNPGTCSTSLGEVEAPRGVTADLYGNVYYADTGSSRTRVVLGPYTSSYFSGNNPLYKALETHWVLPMAGYVYTVVNETGTSTTTGGTATVAGNSCLDSISGIIGTATDIRGDGCPYSISSVDASSGFTNGVAVDAAGNMLFTDPGNGSATTSIYGGLRVLFVQGWSTAGAAASANATGSVAAAGIAMYNAIATNNAGVTPQPGFIYSLAGSSGMQSSPSGIALSATPILGNSSAILDSAITKLTVSPQGNIYIGDSNKVLFYDINTGTIRVLLSSGTSPLLNKSCNGSSGAIAKSAFGDGCSASALASYATFGNSVGLGVAVDGQGNLYMYDGTADSSYMLVRKVLAQGMGIEPTAALATLTTADPLQSLGATQTQTFEAHFPSATAASATLTTSTNPNVSYSSPSCTWYSTVDNSADCTVTVTYTPTAAGPQSATMTLAASGGESVTLNLSSTVTGSVLAVDSATSGGASLLNTATLLSGNTPSAIALDGAGNVYATSGTSILESLTASSSSTLTLASGLSATPTKIAVDQTGNIYYLNGSSAIQELAVASAGSPATYSPSTISYTPSNLGAANPVAIAVDPIGNLLVADEQSSAGTIYKLSLSALNANSQTNCSYPTGQSLLPSLCQSTVFTVGAFGSISELTVDSAGNVYVADTAANAVYKLTPEVDENSSDSTYKQFVYLESKPVPNIVADGLAVDAAGDLYVQTASSTEGVVEYPLSGPTGTGVTVLSGVSAPAGIAVDGQGNLYSADANNTSVTQVQRGAIVENFDSSQTTEFTATLTNVGNQASAQQSSATQAGDFTLAGTSSNGCSFSNNLLTAMSAGEACGMTAYFPALGSMQETDNILFTAISPATTSVGVLTLTGLANTEAFNTTTTIGSATQNPPFYYTVSGTEISFPITVTASNTSTGGGTNNSGPTISDYVAVSVDSGATTNYYFTGTNGLSASLTLNLSGLTAGNHSFTVTFPQQGEFLSSSATSGSFTITHLGTATTWSPSATTQQVSAAIGTGVLNAAGSSGIPGNFVYTTGAPASCAATTTATIDASTYLPIGNYTVYATFCPTDSTDYTSSSASISYTVTQANTMATVGASTSVVAADGTGNYTNLSSALIALPTTGGSIYLKPGTYSGQNAISYPNVSLRGLGGDPTQVILTGEDGAFSSPYTGYLGTGTGSGNANASGDQGSSILDVSKSYYMGQTSGSTPNPIGIVNTTQYTPYNFYAEYLTIQNTYNTDAVTKSTYYVPSSGTCTLSPAAQTLQSLYNSGTECSSQALALWITADQAILNNVNLTSQQDTLYAGSQGCGSTCTSARQYMWKGTITGDVDYAFGDAALVLDHTNFFTTYHGATSTGTETIEAQNKKFETGSTDDYLSGYICNGCILMSQGTGMASLYYGRPYGTYSTWIMLNSNVDQVNPTGWIEFSGDNNLPTSTYAEYNTQPYTDPPVGTAPYPATLFGGTVTPTGGNIGAGVTGMRETTSLDPGTAEAENTIRTQLTAAEATQYYPVTFLSTMVPTQPYTGFTASWNPVNTLATRVNSFVPTASLGALAVGSSVTILGHPQTPGAGVIPTGTYAFYDSFGTNQVCTGASSSCTTLAAGNLDASGEAYLTTSSLASGMHYITMVYGGDVNFAGSTSSTYNVYILQAGQTSTTTTLNVNNTSSTTGTVVTGTVTISPSAATGTISLILDGAAATTCTLSSGSCTWSLSGLAAGAHSLYASYPGNSAYGLSTSNVTTLEVIAPVATGDTRTVTEPSFPSVCQQLTAALTTDPAIQDLDASVDSTNTNIDGARIQAALNSCSATALASSTNLAVELSMDSTGTYNAFLSGPLSMPPNVTLLVDPAVTLYFSRNVQDYDKIAGTHTCGTINGASATSSCLPLIDIPNSSANVGIMGFGKLDGRGGDVLMNGFSTSGYAPPATYTWWSLASQANGEGNQQNPRFIQMDTGSSNITLYKIAILNSPNFHVSSTGKVTNFTAWDVKIVTPTSARNTDGIDPGNVQNATITNSWISDGDDNVAVGAPGSVPAQNISVTNNHFYAGHGESIGSYTTAGVSNILFDHNTSAGNGWVGYGSATLTGVADGNSTAVRIKSANDRGGLVTNIQYSNSCFLDHKTDIQFTPYYSSGDSTNEFPTYTNVLMQNLIFENDNSSYGTVELTGEFNSNNGTPVTNPLSITLDNVTFPSALSSLVNSTAPAESSSTSSAWGTNYSGGTGQYANLTVGAGQVSSNFFAAYSSLAAGANNDMLSNNISLSSLNPPACIFTYLAPELTGPNGIPQIIGYGSTATLNVIMTPTVGGAPYPNGTVTLTDALTGNTFTGTFSGVGDTLAVTISASDLTLGAHIFSATAYTGDTNYIVPPAYQTFGAYTVTVTQAAPAITTLPTASAITYGQTLASSTLTGGVASVPGTFTWTNPTLVPNVGTSSESVTFTPSDTTDYTTATGSVSVTVVAADFTITATGSTTQTVVSGALVNYLFSVSPVNGGYPGVVNFSASGLPSGATATFNPATIAATGGAQTVTMTIQTAATSSQAIKPYVGHKLIPAALGLLLLPLFGIKRMSPRGRWMNRWLCLVLLLGGAAVSLMLSGCGSSSPKQSPRAYNITVTAASGNVQHSSTVTLDVQ